MGGGETNNENEGDGVIHSPFQPIHQKYLDNYPNFLECILDKCKEHEKNGRKEWMTCAFTGQVITYAMFDDATRRIASSLFKRGLRKGDIVMYMCIDFVKVPLFMGGVWRANGIMRACYPEEDEGTILTWVNECRVGWIYCEAEHASKCLSVADKVYWDVEVIVSCSKEDTPDGCVSIYELMEDDGEELPELELSLNDTALILSTSGTTGVSKGAEISHGAIMWMIAVFGQGIPFYSPETGKSNLVLSKCTHISGVVFPFASALSGCPIVVLTHITKQNIFNAVDKFKPGFMFGFPTFLLLLVNDPEAASLDLSGLEIIAGGGAAVTAAMEKALREGLPNLKHVLNLYGLTECVPLVSSMDYDNLTNVVLEDYPKGCLGKLCPGVTAKFLDNETGELKRNPGEIGELCVKCDGLFSGYYMKPVATLEAFDDDGYFKTGDMGYVDENGFIILVDRAKEIFKYRGNHVSPTEIENVILTHPAIGEVCVIGVLDPEGNGHLPRAVCVPVKDVEVTPEEVVEYANEKLASYKQLRGGAFFVKELPKGKTGKVTRKIVEQMELDEKEKDGKELIDK